SSRDLPLSSSIERTRSVGASCTGRPRRSSDSSIALVEPLALGELGRFASRTLPLGPRDLARDTAPLLVPREPDGGVTRQFGGRQLRPVDGPRPPRRPGSDVEADVQDVAVTDDVRLALQALDAPACGLGMGARVYEIAPVDHFAADEAARDVGVDRRRRVERR